MAVFVFDRNLRYLIADGPFIETLGYAPAAVIGKMLAGIASNLAKIPCKDAHQFHRAFDQRLRETVFYVRPITL